MAANRRGVNNSNILLGNEQHVIVVSGDDANDVKEYTRALGITSLYDALQVFANLESASSIQKAKALEDLIFIRLILSGSIQFKEPSLLGLFQSVVGNNFEKLPETSNGRRGVPQRLVEELLNNLDEGKKDVTVIKKFIVLLIGFFGIGFIPVFGGLDFVGSQMGGPGGYLNFILSNLNIMYPIIIGIIASMAAARSMVNHENNIYSIALVKLIDRFLSNNRYIDDIINDPEYGFGLPKPLRDNQLGMALYFQYIKKLQAGYREKLVEGEDDEDRRIEIEKNTAGEDGAGAFPLNFNIFSRDARSGNSCAICLKQLGAAGMGRYSEVCKNGHLFHNKCIKGWIRGGPGRSTCPFCREAIFPDIIEMAQRGGRKRRTRQRRNKRRSTRKN
jgi:hypothetical protein